MGISFGLRKLTDQILDVFIYTVFSKLEANSGARSSLTPSERHGSRDSAGLTQ